MNIQDFVPRTIENAINQYVRPNKVLVITGARRTGKTELIKQIKNRFAGTVELLNGEDFEVQDMLSNRSVSNYANLFGDTALLIVDEAQVIPDIGKIAKLMVDEIEGLRIILTGSSSFEMVGKTGEPLTGRKTTLELFPFSIKELLGIFSQVQLRTSLEQLLLYGSYPEIFKLQHSSEKRMYLNEIVQSYLLKDILMLTEFRELSKLNKLLQLLAYQTGQEVSVQELGNNLSMSKNTVERYLNLLTQAYVIFPLSGFSRNLRKEITKSKKWYFVDVGIRNAIISNFKPVSVRRDIGQLWENFVISERRKYHFNNLHNIEFYFWRTYDRQEIDLIEVKGHEINAIEIKWTQPQKTVKIPTAFHKAYPEAGFNLIYKENIWEEVTKY